MAAAQRGNFKIGNSRISNPKSEISNWTPACVVGRGGKELDKRRRGPSTTHSAWDEEYTDGQNAQRVLHLNLDSGMRCGPGWERTRQKAMKSIDGSFSLGQGVHGLPRCCRE